MNDLHNSSIFKSALDAQALTATANGNIVDTASCSGVELIVNAGDFAFTTTNKITVTLQGGDKADGSDMDNIDSLYLLGNNIVLDATADKKTAHKQGYIGQKRYVRAVFTVAGTVNAPIAAIFQLKPIHMPG